MKMRFKNNLLRLLMAEHGFSGYDLRDALAKRGVRLTVEAIYSWRAGRTEPSGKALSALCDIFGVEAPQWFEKVSEKEVRDGDT
jgi:transcriptional regulator with XRE-family HTH domain